VKRPASALDAARPAGDLGAAAALKRLEEDERKLWNRLQALEADPDADCEDVKTCRDAWRKTGDSLRRYELAVEQDRRDSGMLLPRAELEDYAKGFLVNFCQSVQASLESLCPKLAGLPGPGEVWQTLGPAWKRALSEAIEHSAERPHAGRSCPEWLNKAIQEAVDTYL
jgi:hypothetical protein